MASQTCVWCQWDDVDDPDQLCRPHLAEYEGLSEAELDRMESEQYAEYVDATGGW